MTNKRSRDTVITATSNRTSTSPGRTSTAPVPGWRHIRRRSINLAHALALAAAVYATEDREHQKSANGGRDTDDEGAVTVDPGADFVADGTAIAAAVGAPSASTTRRAVQEVLLQAIADAAAEFRTSAAEHAIAVVAGIGIVSLSVAPHNSLTLLVSARALSTCASQTVTAVAAVILSLVFRAIGRTACAPLFGIALSSARTAHGSGAGELAISAAVFGRVVADGVALELARRGIAASIVATALLATAIAVLAFLDDAVAALLAGNGRDTSVIGETIPFNTVS